MEKVSIQRSLTMRAVRSANNKSTELKLIDYFKKNKIIGWRRNYKLPGKPDFVFPRRKIALFADGCFWHGHNCRGLNPKTNKEYWDKKISRNKNRDKEVNKLLRSKGWEVIRVWECKIPFLSKLFFKDRNVKAQEPRKL
jgi:DNA mismatch endonuclease (patch repair protein)